MDFLPEITHGVSLFASPTSNFQAARVAASSEDMHVWRVADGIGEGLAAEAVSPRAAARSVASTRAEDAEFGAQLVRVWRRRDPIGEAALQEDESDGVGKRKGSVAWVGQTARKVMRSFSTLAFRGRRRSSSGLDGRRISRPLLGESEGASPLLLPSVSTGRVELAVLSTEDVTQPASPPPDCGSDTLSLSSAYWLSSPHPEYQTDRSYIDALTTHLWTRHDGGVFDSIEFPIRRREWESGGR